MAVFPHGQSEYADAVTVTPHDTNDLAVFATALLNIGTSGLVSILPAGQEGTATAVPVYIIQGHVLRLKTQRVYATDLGAGVSIVALY